MIQRFKLSLGRSRGFQGRFRGVTESFRDFSFRVDLGYFSEFLGVPGVLQGIAWIFHRV